MTKQERIMEEARDNRATVFGTASWDMLDLVDEVLERMDCEDLTDEDELFWIIDEAVETELEKTWNCWQVMIHYQSPEDADLQTAKEYFKEDIAKLFY